MQYLDLHCILLSGKPSDKRGMSTSLLPQQRNVTGPHPRVVNCRGKAITTREDAIIIPLFKPLSCSQPVAQRPHELEIVYLCGQNSLINFSASYSSSNFWTHWYFWPLQHLMETSSLFNYTLCKEKDTVSFKPGSRSLQLHTHVYMCIILYIYMYIYTHSLSLCIICLLKVGLFVCGICQKNHCQI